MRWDDAWVARRGLEQMVTVSRPRTVVPWLAQRVPVQSRLVVATGLLTLAAAAWFAANLDHLRGPAVLLWIPAPVAPALATLLFARATRSAHLPLPTRRFWRHLTFAGSLVVLGTVSMAYDSITGPSPRYISPLTMTVYCGAIVIVIWALYRLPFGASAPSDRLKVGLDAGTVMLAAGVFLWHFATRPQLADQGQPPVFQVASALLMALAMVSVFAVAKVALSGHAYINRSALRLLALALATGSLGSAPQGLLHHSYLVCAQVSNPLLSLLAAWAADRQLAADAGEPTRMARRRRVFSPWPYAAVVAVDGLLLAVTWSDRGDDRRAVAVAAVVLTIVVVARQITVFWENGRLLARLDHGATHDALTQLPNRALFAERLSAALATPDPGRRLSVALIDLDDFKGVNDTLGHGVGDALLVAVSQRLAGSVRTGDTVARLGGDEFVVILDDVDPAGADHVVERMLAALAAPIIADGHELLIRVSIGVADGRTGDDASELLREADVAMYAAKNQGGSAYLHYTPAMAGGIVDHAQLGAQLRQALADNQLFLLYQPIVALDTGRLTGVEALVRWAHPTRGVLGPAEFIPIAERTGLIVPLGRWVLRAACRQTAAWHRAYGDLAPAVLNVNVSARELREPDFTADVAAALAETGLAPERLVLEVTETAIFDLGASVANLHALRRMGVRISLDDFGTGQSTLSLLQECPVDELKLDRSFAPPEAPAHRRTMAAAVIHLARALGLHVVAEGVETQGQAARLRDLGYEAAQGFYFAKPLSVAQVEDVMADQRCELH